MIRFKSHSIIFLEPLQTLFINSGRYERQHRTKSIISNRGWAPDLGRSIWRDQVSLCVKSSLWVPGHSCSRGASDHRQGGQDGGFCPGPHITAFIFSLSYFYLPDPSLSESNPESFSNAATPELFEHQKAMSSLEDWKCLQTGMVFSFRRKGVVMFI